MGDHVHEETTPINLGGISWTRRSDQIFDVPGVLETHGVKPAVPAYKNGVGSDPKFGPEGAYASNTTTDSGDRRIDALLYSVC